MKFTITAIGKMKDSAQQALMEEYRKRLPWQVTIRESEVKKSLSGDALAVEEGKLLLASVPEHSRKIVLDERGKSLSSEAFAKTIADWQNQGVSDVSFLIGGASGHGDEVRQQADLLLSFGQMTWPHMLVRLLLVEQLYRAWTILEGHPYHK